jgi:hypothetical protein
MDGAPPAHAPICTISMATLRWRTLKNVDVAIYEHGDVLVRGWLGADYAHATIGWDHVKSQRAALEATDPDVVAVSQPNTRLIRSQEVAAAAFRPGIVISRIRLGLEGGESIKVLWMWRGPSRTNPTSSAVQSALRRAFGKRLESG